MVEEEERKRVLSLKELSKQSQFWNFEFRQKYTTQTQKNFPYKLKLFDIT